MSNTLVIPIGAKDNTWPYVKHNLVQVSTRAAIIKAEHHSSGLSIGRAGRGWGQSKELSYTNMNLHKCCASLELLSLYLCSVGTLNPLYHYGNSYLNRKPTWDNQ